MSEHDDESLRALYRSDRPEPPDWLDQAIVDAARSEAAKPLRRRWRYPIGLGTAASALFALVLWQQLSPVYAPLPTSEQTDPLVLQQAPRDAMPPAGADDRHAGDAPARAAPDEIVGSGSIRRLAVERYVVAPDQARAAELRGLVPAPADALADGPACPPEKLAAELSGAFSALTLADAVSICATDDELTVHVQWDGPAPCPSSLSLPRFAGPLTVRIAETDDAPWHAIEIRDGELRRILRCEADAWIVDRRSR